MMKCLGLKDFGELCEGYKYVFELANQSDEYKSRCFYVIEDRRVFDNIIIALNPDCAKFVGEAGSCLTIDGIRKIYVRQEQGDSDFYFDIFCSIKNVGDFTMTFLATKL